MLATKLLSVTDAILIWKQTMLKLLEMYVARHSVVSLEFARCSQIQFRFYRNLGRFQFEEKFLFNFLAIGIHEWNSIFTEFPLHSIFLPKFFGISFQWFALRKFDVYPDFLEIFPGSFSFRSFVVFWSPMFTNVGGILSTPSDHKRKSSFHFCKLSFWLFLCKR